jgi:outer membrane protein
MEKSLIWMVRATLLALWLACSGAGAQSPGRKLTLPEAMELAVKNYPAVRARLEELRAAQGGVALSRTSYLPRLDALWQSNRATRNNIFGLLLPQSVISPISGPALSSTSGSGAWGSAAGLLFSWEPFDFGYRRAEVNAARASQSLASAEVAVTRLDVAVAATDAFLTLLAAEQTVRIAQADINRREVFAKAVQVLVNNQLRPGADASRADAELARARIALARAQQQEQVSRAILAETLGIAGTTVEIEPGPLLGPPPQAAPPPSAVSQNPLAIAQKARVDELRSQVHILDRSYYPKFDFQSTVFGRGSGANTDGSVAGGLNGLGLERANWAAGLTVTFPLFDIFAIHARKQIELSNERAEAARYDQSVQQLTGQLQQAEAALDGARQVALETPVELRAAGETESQATARYKAGLATIVEVTEAQSLLVQADIDNALARLNVWHSLAAVAAAQGNLEPFTRLLEQNHPGGH